MTARRYDADRSMLTWVTSARHGPGLCQQPFGNLGGSPSVDVREQPAGPAASTIPVCHRSCPSVQLPLTGSCSACATYPQCASGQESR